MSVYYVEMKDLIKKYLEAQTLAWSPTTLRSETYRLNAVAGALTSPLDLWQALERKNIAPYARVTVWIRVCRFIDWAISRDLMKGPNEFARFKEENARLFKNAYTKKTPQISYEEAKARIEAIEDAGSKRLALELLGSGLRYFERARIEASTVIGKGGKQRQVYLPNVRGPMFDKTYRTFHRHLAAVGLKPHDLRKLCMARLVEKGANEFELCEIAGWSKLDTASSYIKASRSRVKKLMED